DQKDLASQLRVNDRIVQLLAVSEENLRLLYNIADVLVFPSFYEGFGLPPLEAMASGTPVVCAKKASLPEMVGEGGILLDPTDIKGFADAIASILTDETLKADLSRRGLQRAKRFTWERCAEEMLAVYESLHSENKRRREDK
ncbi:MAG: glycosyltransferase family 4 protein, partial [Thaumarchaeota archaeon]|nr:glycosyltransferase family 4 protein [Nitrososphaerota archaeon]